MFSRSNLSSFARETFISVMVFDNIKYLRKGHALYVLSYSGTRNFKFFDHTKNTENGICLFLHYQLVVTSSIDYLASILVKIESSWGCE